MYGYNDITCVCGQRIGWAGELTDCPDCPRCGTKADLEELKETGAKLEEMRRKMLMDVEEE